VMFAVSHLITVLILVSVCDQLKDANQWVHVVTTEKLSRLMKLMKKEVFVLVEK